MSLSKPKSSTPNCHSNTPPLKWEGPVNPKEGTALSNQEIKSPLTLPEILMALNEGGLVPEVQEAIREVTLAVRRTQKKGEVTIKLAINPAGGNAVSMVESVAHKAPKFDVIPTTFYTDDFTGALSRRNPLQPELQVEEPSK